MLIDDGCRGQCGGQGWTGPTCCTSGSTCVAQNPYYSQCLPGSPTTSSSSTRTTTVVSTTTVPGPTTTAPPNPSGTATYSGNPFTGVNLWANEYYASQVNTLAVPQLSGPMATAAAKVAQVPSFMWM